jgi:hypothetical protein
MGSWVAVSLFYALCTAVNKGSHDASTGLENKLMQSSALQCIFLQLGRKKIRAWMEIKPVF